MGELVLNFLQADDWTVLDPQYTFILILIGVGLLVLFGCALVRFFEQ